MSLRSMGTLEPPPLMEVDDEDEIGDVIYEDAFSFGEGNCKLRYTFLYIFI